MRMHLKLTASPCCVNLPFDTVGSFRFENGDGNFEAIPLQWFFPERVTVLKLRLKREIDHINVL